MSSKNTQRARGNKREKSWLFRFSFITLNFYLIYLLINISWFLSAANVFLIITLILFLITAIRGRKKSNYRKSDFNKDLLHLVIKYTKVNRIYIIATVIGLILASIIISQSILLSSSYRQNVFSDFLANKNSNILHFDVYNLNSESQFNNWKTIISNLKPIITSNNFNVMNVSTTASFYSSILIGHNETSQINIQILNPQMFTKMEKIPSFPFKNNYSSEFSFVVSRNDDPLLENYLSSNTTLNFLNSSSIAYSLNYTNLWLPSTNGFNYIKQNSNLGQINFYGTLFVNETLFWNIFNALNNDFSQKGGSFLLATTEISSNLPIISDTNINQIRSDLRKLLTDVQNSIYNQTPNFMISINSPLDESLQYYQSAISSVSTVIVLVTGPLIGLSLYLVYFSLTLVEQRKRRLISIMKIRGNSESQLNAMLLSEVLNSSIIAVLVGMVLSIPWTALSLKASGILKFNLPSIAVVIPDTWYWRLPIIGVIIALDVNISNIRSLAFTSIDESEIVEEKKEPFWQRYYIDLILFSLSVIYWLIIRYVPFNNAVLFNILLFLLGSIMLIIMLIGSPLVVARYFSSIIGYISDFLWKVRSDLIALATRNMRNNRFSASKLSALLMMGMMLSFISVIVPQTFVNWNHESNYYNIGSDISITGVSPFNTTQWNLLNVDGVASYTEFFTLNYQSISNLKSNIYQYYILGINPSTFSKTAFWEQNYASQPLNQILTNLSANDSIGIQQDIMAAYGLKLGEKSTFILGNLNLKLNITTSFKYFPNLVHSLPSVDSSGNYFTNEMYILANFNLIKQLSGLENYITTGAYIKVNPNANITKVADTLSSEFKNNNSIVIKTINGNSNDFTSLFVNKILTSSLQGMLIVTFITSIAGIMYFSFITLSERKREIGVFRAIGMVRRQLFYLLVFESLTLLLVGIILGGIMGLYISSNFVFMLTGGSNTGTIPPFHLSIPWGVIAIFSSIMIIFSILAAAIPANITASKQTGSILRTD